MVLCTAAFKGFAVEFPNKVDIDHVSIFSSTIYLNPACIFGGKIMNLIFHHLIRYFMMNAVCMQALPFSQVHIGHPVSHYGESYSGHRIHLFDVDIFRGAYHNLFNFIQGLRIDAFEELIDCFFGKDITSKARFNDRPWCLALAKTGNNKISL